MPRRPIEVQPSAWLLAREALVAALTLYRRIGRRGERGQARGPRVMVIPGFLTSDRSTLGLQRALSRAGYRVTSWGLGFNLGLRADTMDRIIERVAAFGAGNKVILVGWSLGGIFAREVAKARPDLVEKVVTMGSPFSGDPHANNLWRLYEMIAGHKVDNPPIDSVLGEKPPVPTLALWSRRDGIVSAASARGEPGESDRQVELDCSHMGFAVSGRAYPKIVAAMRDFS